jgi:signal transduction histidine kinase
LDLIKRAGNFFAAAITPIEKTQRDAHDSTVQLKRFIESLSQRTVELAASNLELNLEITQRKAAEAALQKSEHHYSELLKQSDSLQEQLRRLSRQILLAQEEERKRISRELHDVIAQTLTGINLRLATLKKEASISTHGLDRNIARTQRLVEKSVNLVHEFARELRPAVLDDLGLIPALHSFVKLFSKRTRIHVHLKAFAGVEQLDSDQRTIFYRVAQEALTNVSRHAHASRVEVAIEKQDDGISLKINDNGKSFEVERVLNARGRKRLGLLGMRERVEMVGGRFGIASVPGQGTTITALIPIAKNVRESPAQSGKNGS